MRPQQTLSCQISGVPRRSSATPRSLRRLEKHLKHEASQTNLYSSYVYHSESVAINLQVKNVPYLYSCDSLTENS